MTDQSIPAVWVDGDPLMEKIAAAVWEQCQQHDSGLVVDDPRNIAAVAVAVVRAQPAAVVPAADRAALVEAAAQAIRDSNGSHEALEWWRTHPQLIPAHVYADAVLAVLPAPADRAAVLEEAAAAVAADTGFHIRYGAAIDYATHYAALLRRMAAEATAVPVVGVAADTTPGFGTPDCTCIPWTRQGGKPRVLGPTDTADMIGGWERGLDCPHHRPLVPAQPGKEALPCGHRPDHCWGCPGGCAHCRCHADERNA